MHPQPLRLPTAAEQRPTKARRRASDPVRPGRPVCWAYHDPERADGVRAPSTRIIAADLDQAMPDRNTTPDATTWLHDPRLDVHAHVRLQHRWRWLRGVVNGELLGSRCRAGPEAGMRRVRPHQVVFGIGLLVALFTARERRHARAHPLGRHFARPARGVRQRPDRDEGRVLRRGRHDAADRRVARVAARSQLRAGQPDDRRTTRKNAKRRFRDYRAGVWMQTLLRDPAAGLMHSFLYFGFVGLFIVTVVLEIDHQMPDALEVPARPHVRGVQGGRQCGRGPVPGRDRVGDRPPLRAAPVSHPHQDQARGRGDPRHVRASSGSPASSSRRCASRSEAARASRSGRSSATGLANLIDTWSTHTLVIVHRWLWGVHVRGVPRVPRDPAHHEAAAHVHVADEHVPERPRPAQGRDEADAEPHGDRARELRRGEDRGLHVEAAVRHRRVHDLRALHVGVPGARDGQAARPPRDRAEGRRGDGRDRRSRSCRRRSASTATSRSAPTACSSASRPRSCGRARAARRATRSARSTSRSSTRSSTCAATSR